ncbi:hypothetical protein AB9G26_09005 [Francisella philomiragia]|uniref:hypothetical protein n=1 Tax=Francisella philomiragia TaxID=28110 RepID=UPI003515410A
MAKLESDYYYHLTNSSTLQFIRKGGFTSSAYRTGGDLRASETGAFCRNKKERFHIKSDEMKWQIIELILQSIDLKGHAIKDNLDYTLNHILSTLVRKHHQLEFSLDKSLWGKYFREGALKNHSSFYARNLIDEMLKKKLKEMFLESQRYALVNSTADRRVDRKAISEFKKSVKDAMRKVDSEMITTLANLYTERWYDAEEIVCATHSYFFDINGVLDSVNTYMKHLGGGACSLLRVKKSCAAFFPDESQWNAFLTSSHIVPNHIEIAETSSDKLRQAIDAIKLLHRSMGLNESLNIDTDCDKEPSDKKASVEKFTTFFKPLG